VLGGAITIIFVLGIAYIILAAFWNERKTPEDEPPKYPDSEDTW